MQAPFIDQQGQMWTQIDGVAMGSPPLGVKFTNLYLGVIEQRYLEHSYHRVTKETRNATDRWYCQENHTLGENERTIRLFYKGYMSTEYKKDEAALKDIIGAHVVLAVFGVCLASAQFTPEVEAERARFFEAFRAAKQAAASSKYTEPYRGPFAATVPAGVDGRVTPVSDTAEVKAATDEFFRAYKAQVEATKGSAPYSARAAPAESASYVLKTDPATSAKYVLKTDTATSNRYLYKAVPATSPEYRSGSETSVKYLLKTDPATSSKYLYKPDPATAAEYAAMPYSAGSAKYVVKTDPQTSNKYLYKAVPTTSGTYVVKDDPQTAHKYELQAVPQTSATYRAKTDPAYLASHGYSKSPVYVAEFRAKGDPAYKANSDPAYVAKVVPAATYGQQPRWPGPFASSVPAGLPGSPGQVPYTQEVLDAKYAFQKAYQRQLDAVSN
ncbi:uncharacterized protein [Macrobrachium rosenbergii]|uniref:uncharacterized protein n=1 Tax=Macrobrachium rosenbergii TaxID=79674 RepID=UPI0034D3D2FE